MKTTNEVSLLPVDRNKFEKILISAGVIYNNPGSRALTWKPYGLSMLNQFTYFLRGLFPKFGYQEYVFPFLSDIKNFDKLSQKIYEFDKGVFKTGTAVLRPSGEIVIYPIFKDWIKTIEDLPLKVFQIGVMFRNGHRSGIFRLNEANFFVEGHSAHSSRYEADQQVVNNGILIDNALSFFGLPVIKTERPLWTNKPVAEKSFGYDAILPNGETALAASNYAQMQVFSKVFEIGFFDKNSIFDYTYQSTFGFSFRPFLFSLWLLSDQHGLRLLPSIAPYKIAIIEINPGNRDAVSSLVNEVKEKLTKLNISFIHDQNFKKPLAKRFSQLELLGVPLRIEVGMDEVESGLLKIKRRDKGYFVNSNLFNLENLATALLKEIEDSLRSQLISIFNSSQINVSDDLEIRKCLTDKKVAKIYICYSQECINGLQKKIGYGELLGVSEARDSDNCIFCNKKTNYLGYFSRRI